MDKKVIIIGLMDNTIDHTFECANRVYDKKALCPTINTCGGGGLQPKVIRKMKQTICKDCATTINPVRALNDERGLCRTIKNQYWKNSLANFTRQGTWGATGVIRKCHKNT